jgi:hypothetical protein
VDDDERGEESVALVQADETSIAAVGTQGALTQAADTKIGRSW